MHSTILVSLRVCLKSIRSPRIAVVSNAPRLRRNRPRRICEQQHILHIGHQKVYGGPIDPVCCNSAGPDVSRLKLTSP